MAVLEADKALDTSAWRFTSYLPVGAGSLIISIYYKELISIKKDIIKHMVNL